MKETNALLALKFPRAFGVRNQGGTSLEGWAPSEQGKACLALHPFVLISGLR
jgi:hypothetical protein